VSHEREQQRVAQNATIFDAIKSLPPVERLFK